VTGIALLVGASGILTGIALLVGASGILTAQPRPAEAAGTVCETRL
jgi:hypothetical protein